MVSRGGDRRRAGRRDHHELFDEQRRHGEPLGRRGIRCRDQGEVELAAGEFVEQPARPLFREVQFDGRMLRVERAEHLGDEADAQGGGGAEPHPAALEAGEFGEFAPHRFGVGEHAARERQQRFARDRQRAAAAGPVEQLGAEILLERGDLAAQRGLGEVQLLGGTGEVAEPGHLDEAAQLLEVHIDSVRASSRRYICIGVIGCTLPSVDA